MTPRLHLQYGLVLEVDGFLLYCPELALGLHVRVRIFLKIFNVTLSITFNFFKYLHCKYFITDSFSIFMLILLSIISIHCNICVKLCLVHVHSSNCKKSFSLIYIHKLYRLWESCAILKELKQQIEY